MQKTLAQLKRDLKLGVKLEIILFEEFGTNNIPEKLKGIREITKIKTNAVCLGKSWLEFPKASNFEYREDTFKVVERKENGEIWQIRIYKIIK